MPIAIIALVRLGPRKAARAIARIRNGQARKASITREIAASIQPPRKPAARPIGTPSSSEIETETTPASIEACVPQTTRENTSRPISSVPNQCSALGGLRIAPQLVAIGSCGASQPANSASTMKPMTTARPNIAARRRRSLRQARCQGPSGSGGCATGARSGRQHRRHQPRSLGLRAK